MKRLPSCSIIPRNSCAAPEFLRPRVLGYTCRAIGWWENRQTPLLFTQTLEQTVGILCRVVIVRVDGYIFIFLYCIPVVIISAQSR